MTYWPELKYLPPQIKAMSKIKVLGRRLEFRVLVLCLFERGVLGSEMRDKGVLIELEYHEIVPRPI